jgi:Methyltransferase domain
MGASGNSIVCGELASVPTDLTGTKMSQTPIHEHHNPDLLRFIPPNTGKIVEIGCSSGALAREYKLLFPSCEYIGIEIDDSYADRAKRYCDQCLTLDIESTSNDFWLDHANTGCWIFGDTLEHLKDPWKILHSIRANMSKEACIVACIPNVQHWSMQARLSMGDFRYQASGLLDKTHLRWFTRQTMIEMFDQTGFEIAEGMPRIFDEPGRDAYLEVIAQMAKVSGADPQTARTDAMALQYVIRAIPK